MPGSRRERCLPTDEVGADEAEMSELDAREAAVFVNSLDEMGLKVPTYKSRTQKMC